MNTLPAVGQRVSFRGDERTGPCIGSVTRILPAIGNDEAVSYWRVLIKCDVCPTPWPHGKHGEFAVEVHTLSPLYEG